MLRKLALGTLASALLAAGGLPGQDGVVGRSYLITPKLGMDDQFEAALSTHAALRRAEMDPWTWHVYTIETGEDAGAYFIISGSHAWSDFDAYDASLPFQQRVGQHWSTTMAPLVGEWSSMLTKVDTSLSALPPAMAQQSAFVHVTGFGIRPGMERQFFGAVAQAHTALRGAGWPQRYAWVYPVSGHDDGPIAWLVTYHASWADMAEPDPSFDAVLTRALGAAGFSKWSDQFGATLRGTTSATLRFRPGLSVIR